MKVELASPTAFHLFDLAVQLRRAGSLQALHTAIPKSRLPNELRERAHVANRVVPLVGLQRGLGRSRLGPRLDRTLHEAFDRAVASELGEADVFHSMSGFCTRAFELARRGGAITVCDRGSTHIVEQDRLLRDEHERWAVPYEGIDPWIVDRELLEYDRADMIFVPSKPALESFTAQGVAGSKLRKIPYGVDLELFHPGVRDQNFRVLFVGRLSLQKGLPYLLRALELVEDDLDLRAEFIGPSAPETRALLGRSRARPDYIGTVPRAQLQAHYARASVLVLPSIQEGFGLVMVQAMACGTPVIATSATGVDEVIQDGVEGFVIPPRDAEAIAEKLTRLFDDVALRERMGQAALERARSLGGWDVYGQKAIEAYEEELGTR